MKKMYDIKLFVHVAIAIVNFVNVRNQRWSITINFMWKN